MVISKKKYIYIAVPKTGTTSVQEFLLKNDSDASKNSCEIDGVSYRFKEHMLTRDIKNILGNDFNDYKIIAFIRNPYSRIVSSYHFYKKGAKEWVYVNGVNSVNNKKRSMGANLRILIAKKLPFKVWAFIYPYKSNIEYIFDNDGKHIVSHIGVFENLNEDLKKIFQDLDISFDVQNLPQNNISKHDSFEKYFQDKWFCNLLKLRHVSFRDDLEFYYKYSESNN